MPKAMRAFTALQVGYWAISATLIVVGLGALVGAVFIPSETSRFIASEIGVAILIAGIIAVAIDPFFKRQLAQDVFLAAFRHVLPSEFKDEIEKILKFDFIAEKQVWIVQIDKISDQVVLVTTTYERIIRNKTKSDKSAKAHYEVEDYKFPDGPTKIIECAIQYQTTSRQSSVQNDREHDVEVETDSLSIRPGEAATLSGKATQYRRINDSVYETFRDPIVNPQIRVVIDEAEFSHSITFGTHGDQTKDKYDNLYTLSGVYFPGQFMVVRWWPKPPPAIKT